MQVFSELQQIDRIALASDLALQTRIDRKYLVDSKILEPIILKLADQVAVVQNAEISVANYETIYFDTANRDFHKAAAYKRRHRFKIRTRTYLDSQTSFLELKLKTNRLATRKIRIPVEFQTRDRLDASQLDWINAQLKTAGLQMPAGIEKVITNEFHRVTLVGTDLSFRATLDFDLKFDHSLALKESSMVLLETKSASAPNALDRALWQSGIRPRKISKYAIGMALKFPDLPRNKWARVINRYFS